MPIRLSVFPRAPARGSIEAAIGTVTDVTGARFRAHLRAALLKQQRADSFEADFKRVSARTCARLY
jgi:hypothetical protein